MLQVGKFYNSNKMSSKSNRSNKPKSSVNAPKLSSTPAPKQKAKKSKSTSKAGPKKSKKSNKENERPVTLDVLEEDIIDAESLSDDEEQEEQVRHQEPDFEDEEREIDENRENQEGSEEEVDDEEFAWKTQLLSYVEEYPVLYDKANPDFKDKYRSAAVWAEIVSAMNSTGLFSTLYLKLNFVLEQIYFVPNLDLILE